MKPKTALLLGSSGSVGHQILKALLTDDSFNNVIVFVRKTAGESNPKLIQKALPEMSPASLSTAVTETLNEYNQSDIFGFSALGVGAGTAKLSIDQHRAVDVELNRAFAQTLRKSAQVKYFAFLSAIGSNPNAKTTGGGAAGMPRYARVKGEAEEAVKQHGPKNLGIFRPAMIRGSLNTPKLLDAAAPLFDVFIPKKYHSVSTEQLGQAMVAASLKDQKGVEIYNYPEMMKLISGSK